MNLKSKTDQCTDGIPILANGKTYRFNQIDKHFLAMFWNVMTIGLNVQVVFPRGIQISFICLTRNHWSSFKLKIFRTNPFVWLNLPYKIISNRIDYNLKFAVIRCLTSKIIRIDVEIVWFKFSSCGNLQWFVYLVWKNAELMRPYKLIHKTNSALIWRNYTLR